jgi:hypothetical protein
MMDGPFEVDVRGREHSEKDPQYYVLTDRFGRVICDTLNADHRFTMEEGKVHLEALAGALNREMAPRPAGHDVVERVKEVHRQVIEGMRSMWVGDPDTDRVLVHIENLGAAELEFRAALECVSSVSAPPGWDADAIRAQTMLDCVSWIDDLYRAATDEVSKDAYREASGVILAVYGETAPQQAALAVSTNGPVCHPTDPHCNWPECRNKCCPPATSVSAPPGWQSIETAPHEQKVLVGWWYNGEWECEAAMASHGWRRNGISTMSWHGQATHWQSLPPPPIASAAGGTGEP